MFTAEAPLKRILVIENEESVATEMCTALKHHGHQVDVSVDGGAGLIRAREGDYDLLILNLTLPGVSGFEILETLRSEGSRLRILILSAKSDESGVLRGLELGADDYISKAFSPRELIARVHAQFRREQTDSKLSSSLKLPAGISINLDRLEVYRDEAVIHLTPREGKILRYLIQHRNKIVTRGDLLVDVWNYANGKIETRTVDIHIVGLRRKIEPDPANPTLIQTVRGLGYRWYDSPKRSH